MKELYCKQAFINKERPTILDAVIEEKFKKVVNPVMSDDEIKRANSLEARNRSKQFNVKEEHELEELKTKRENEIKRLFPGLNFLALCEIEGGRRESERQYPLAEGYLNNIRALSETKGAVYHYALYLEKLRNWQDEPKTLEANFLGIYNGKQRNFESLTKKIKNAKHSGKHIRKLERDVNDPTKVDAQRICGVLENEELVMLNLVPNYMWEAVLFDPSLVEDAFKKLYDYYHMKGVKRKNIRNSLELRNQNINKLKSLLNRLEMR